MHIPTLIERKRNGEELAPDEIAALIDGFTRGEIPDYQMSAWAMAVFFRGMTPNETGELTSAMMKSGRVLEYPAGSPPKVDKHSTGGIGDKVSLVLAPLLACDEVWVPMISGRGLGITGGTLDKLESIPGFNVNLDEARALRQLEKIGVFMIGQTADICPADKKLYALRDVTGTVPSPPLIVASIMSKKLAENLDRLVLDVKFGSGAFMKTRAEAEQLAAGMSAVGKQVGVEISHLLSPMDAPLGRTVGNALEVAEAVETLQGRGPRELVELTLDLGGQGCDRRPRATCPLAGGRRGLAKVRRLGRGAGWRCSRPGENERNSSRPGRPSPARAAGRSDQAHGRGGDWPGSAFPWRRPRAGNGHNRFCGRMFPDQATRRAGGESGATNNGPRALGK